MNVDKGDFGGILFRQLSTDMALRRLVTAGPVVANPDAEPWVLRQLVRTGRIARLRRGIYLVPDAKGRMVPPAVVAALLAPDGYISFYGALLLHGLSDQDTDLWGVVASRARGPLRYGRARIEFVPVLRRARQARPRTRRIARTAVRLAPPDEAFIACLERPRFAPTPTELLRILRVGLQTRRLSVARLRRRALASGSPYVASRLGLLLELATGKRDLELYEFARRSHRWRPLLEASAQALRDSSWRLLLPASRGQLLRAAG